MKTNNNNFSVIQKEEPQWEITSHTKIMQFMMTSLLLLQIFFCMVLIVHQMGTGYSQFQAESQFVPTIIPKDPNQARQLLGYNKYDRSEVRNSDKAVLYGNNWEQFAN
ncbi:hypothetical protein PPYR_00616 [Photinus pyralis]|uniref:Uncharacterized protein n=1 Tax=Photinus pyralis TaxID=7054 RepID=A0A1Y1KWW1_PHOPY|nr:hypothetical protein PPYR_00616 [Photinus pyralis]